MDIQFLGGALEIGGSAILIHIDGKNILLDAGIRQGMSKDPLTNYRVIQECGGLDAIIISHAHLDHIGSLTVISKEYPNARIYMNHMTMDLVRVEWLFACEADIKRSVKFSCFLIPLPKSCIKTLKMQICNRIYLAVWLILSLGKRH
jgi:predicted metal-dependent RNase